MLKQHSSHYLSPKYLACFVRNHIIFAPPPPFLKSWLRRWEGPGDKASSSIICIFCSTIILLLFVKLILCILKCLIVDFASQSATVCVCIILVKTASQTDKFAARNNIILYAHIMLRPS